MKRKNLTIYLGILLVALGVVLSATLLEQTVLAEGTLAGTNRRAAAWAFCRIALVGLGVYLLVRRPRITVIHLCALAPGVALSVFLGAVVLQFVHKPPPILCGWRSSAPAAEKNELGFRGRPIKYSDDDYVIVLLGDSHVESRALQMESMPAHQLESDLNTLGKKVRVVSIGAGGYGQDQELLALQEYLGTYRADMVVLWQTPGNDVWNNVFKTNMADHTPKPTFWLEGGSLHGPSESLGQRLADSSIMVVSLWQRVFSLPFRDRDWECRLPEPYSPLDYYDGPVNREWQERWRTNLGRMRDENLATEKSHMAVMLSPRSKRTQYGLDLTHALLRRIEKVVNSQNGTLVIFRATTGSFSSAEDEMYVLNGKYFRVSKRQFDANFSEVNRGFRTETVPVTERDWRVSRDDGHFNEKATAQLMRDLAQRIAALIPDRSS